MGTGTYLTTMQVIIRITGRSATSQPPGNATYLKGCSCCIIKEKDESNRVWVTYSTYNTYHYYNYYFL